MKTALVTGGNKGIGLALTRYLLQRNHHVIVLARDFADFDYVDHTDVTMVEYDLNDIAGIPALIASLQPIDVLINNAGIMLSLPYDDYPQDKIDQIMKINIEAPIALIREVSKHMIAQQSGRIVNNASIAGQIGHPDIWYGISKAGLINATKSFAKLLGPEGIVINAVAASPVDTEMLAVIPEHRKMMFKQSTVAGRFAEPQEVAEAMGWLATESPDYINGSCIDINNGSYLR